MLDSRAGMIDATRAQGEGRPNGHGFAAADAKETKATDDSQGTPSKVGCSWQAEK
jgi:hypothetical protein